MDGIRRDLEDGEIVFRQDEPSDFACIVESGFVDILSEADGLELPIASLGPGELFGEMGVIDGKARSATARAKGSAVIREFEAKDFLNQIAQDPKFASAIMSVLVARLRRSTMGADAPPPPPIGLPSLDATEAGPNRIDDPPPEPSLDDASLPDAPDHEPPPGPAAVSGPQRAAHDLDNDGIETRPTVLIAPLAGDPEGICGIALESWLADSGAFAGIPVTDGRLADPTLSPRQRADLARSVLAEADAALVLTGRAIPEDRPDWLELSVITAWPDDESRVGGFSAFDTFCVPISADERTIAFLKGMVGAAIPGAASGIVAALEQDLPDSLEAAQAAGLLTNRSLKPPAAARQHIAYGNATARLGCLEDGTLRLYDAVDAYRAALHILPEDDKLGRGLAHLHMAVVLNAIADRDKRERERERAREAAAAAAAQLDRTRHVYPYLTANARLGAILYRQATQNRKLATCKAGINAFNAALAVCDRHTMPDPWADTMNGLGQLLVLLGRLVQNTEFITWAAQVCRNAMEVRTRDRNPLAWARTLNNHATALYILGRAEADTAMLDRAIDGFSDAMEVFSHHRIAGLMQTARRNRTMAKVARARVADGDGSPDGEWWVA